ncbi:MAG: hypothetical protein IID31_07730 [Planctomycetes bacterium]|nr:hypothetical protein [Planctomycetota bacterium]
MWLVPALMCVAPFGTAGQTGPCEISVALYGAESTPGRLDEIADKIEADPRVKSVQTFNIESMTPTLAQLLTYDAVMVWTNGAPQNPSLLGDTLADYVDLNGGVVVAMFAMAAPDPARSITGRFLDENYYCIMRIPGSIVSGRAALGTVHDPTHPVIENVQTLDGGPNSFRTSAPLHPNATRIADWSTGEVLAAARDDLIGGRVDLGLWPPSTDSASNGWVASTDGARLMANAIFAVSACSGAAGFTLCDSPIASSAMPDPSLECVRPGLTPGEETIPTVSFSTATGGVISEITLWGVYDKGAAPPEQPFRIDFWQRLEHAAPRRLLHSATATATPLDTGIMQTFTGSPLPIYEFQLTLDPPLEAVAGMTLWMGPTPLPAGGRWCWQLASESGTYAIAHTNGTFTKATGTPAHAICRPGGATGCFDFGGSLFTHTGSQKFRGHAFTFPFDEHLSEIRADLSFVGTTSLHWSVLESQTREGDYTPVFTSVTTPTGSGRSFYSSGSIDVPLLKDRFYLVGLAWGAESVTYYTDRATIPRSWELGRMEFAFGINDFQPPLIDPIPFSSLILSPNAEYAISMCFGGQSLCVCDLFDQSTGPGVCDIFDFLGFQSAYVLQNPSACDLDTSTGVGRCDIFDFLAFQSGFVTGCR